MKLYWTGTNVTASRFRLWLHSKIVPKTVQEAWARRGEDTLRYYAKDRFIQLQPYRDDLLGLTERGKVYLIRIGYSDLDISMNHLMDSPVDRF